MNENQLKLTRHAAMIVESLGDTLHEEIDTDLLKPEDGQAVDNLLNEINRLSEMLTNSAYETEGEKK